MWMEVNWEFADCLQSSLSEMLRQAEFKCPTAFSPKVSLVIALYSSHHC